MGGGNSHQRAVARAAKARMEKQVSETVAEYLARSRSETVQVPIKSESAKPSHTIHIALAAFALLAEALALMFGLSILTLGAAVLFWFVVWKYREERLHKKNKTGRYPWVFGISSAVLLTVLTTVIPFGIKGWMEKHSVTHETERNASSSSKPNRPPTTEAPKLEPPKAETRGTTDALTAKPGHPKPKEPAKVLDPKSTARFHERIGAYLFSLGENGLTTSATVEGLKKGNIPFAGLPITIFAKESDDKIHYRITIWDGIRPIEITDGEFIFNEPYGDRNFNDAALEMVDDHQKPVLQVIWKTPSHLVINGIFRMQNGSVVI